MVELPVNTEGNVREKDEAEPHTPFVTITGLYVQRGLKKGSVIFLYHRNEASALKTVGISHKQNKAKIYSFFKILFPFALCIGIVRNLIFFSLLYARRAFENPTYWFQTLVHTQYLSAVFRLCGKTSLSVSVP